jgi:AcrR family transcriptional regulator
MTSSAPAASTDELNLKPDGRLLRSERSRHLIIEATIELIGEGILIPTAQQVAERANVGIRSVFRHFDDMDSIFETTNERVYENVKHHFTGGDRSGALNIRVIHAVEQLTNGYKAAKNFMLSGRIRIWNTPVIEKNYGLNQLRLKKELEDWIPEILNLGAHDRESAYALTSFDYWYRLTDHQKVSQEMTVELISKQIQQLF